MKALKQLAGRLRSVPLYGKLFHRVLRGTKFWEGESDGNGWVSGREGAVNASAPFGIAHVKRTRVEFGV